MEIKSYVTSKTSGEFLTDREWLRSAVGGKELILRGESALLYLQLSSGYLDEREICVYSKENISQDNLFCKIVDSFDEIEYFKDTNILCTTVNQTINDLLDDYDKIEEQSLIEALSDFYHSNGECFDNLKINPNNKYKFEQIKKWAINYYVL